MEIKGDLTDEIYRDDRYVIIQILNCVATRSHGLSKILGDKYPYSDSYKYRKCISPNLNRAEILDRPVPGSIKCCSSGDIKGPNIINIFGQFYMGKSGGFYSKRILAQRNIDDHLRKGIHMDTKDNRLKWFEEGLTKIITRFAESPSPMIFLFPYKIGCNLAGGNWPDYHQKIKEFAIDMESIDKEKQVYIVNFNLK